MSKIKYIAFFKKDAVFDSERIAGELLDVCEQTDLGEDGIMCRMQVVQGELVHCKDCKYWDKQQSGLQYRIGNCERGGWKGMVMTEDDFCSRGEKKDD